MRRATADNGAPLNDEPFVNPQKRFQVSYLPGNGDGTFQAEIEYSVGAAPFDVAVHDFNRDGKLDLAVTNANSNSVSILLGNGDGTFGTPTELPASFGPAPAFIACTLIEMSPCPVMKTIGSVTLAAARSR